MSAAAATRQASAARPWTHYVNDHFFDRTDLEPNLERLAFRLERLARDKPWCVTSNDELMTQLGCSKNTLAAILNRGESLGWFRRVLIPGRHGRATGRLGFVLFVRPTDRPVATPETFDQVVDRMHAANRGGSDRSRTLPFPAPIPQESGTAVPRNRAPVVPKNWEPSSYSKEVTRETTTTDAAGTSAEVHAFTGSLSSCLDPDLEETRPPIAEIPGEGTTRQTSAVDASTQSIGPSPAPIAMPAAPDAPCITAGLTAELELAAAGTIPGASREWLAALLRDCGAYGLELALLVVAWVKVQRPEKPRRYAEVALKGWLTKLRSGELTLEDVRAEVRGGSSSPGSARPFEAKVCLARMASMGWALVPEGADRVKWSEIPGRGAPLWRHIASDLRQQVAEHRAELKAYVLERAAERARTVAIRA